MVIKIYATVIPMYLAEHSFLKQINFYFIRILKRSIHPSYVYAKKLFRETENIDIFTDIWFSMNLKILKQRVSWNL